MATYTSAKIRNVALVGHGGSGKTSLAEAMLFVSGANSRLGSVQGETSTLDYEPEEQKRKGSIASSLAWIDHEGHKVNLLDTPGDQSFIYDSLCAMRGADAAIVVVSAPDGVEVQTERVYNAAQNSGLARAVFINKMDRDRADPDVCLAQIRETFGARPVPLQVPIGREGDFRGVVSLFQRKAFVYAMDGSGAREVTDVPEELQDEVDAAWEVLVESVAETDEALLEIYLDTFELSAEQVRTGFRKALKEGLLLPVIFGAATACVGAAALLDLTTWAFPSPLERPAVEGVAGDDAVEVAVSEEGGFVAQIIHTTVDEFSGKTSLFRVLRGTLPSDHVVSNSTHSSPERLGAVYSLRGKERTTVPTLVTGDILGVAKLKNTHTGDTLVAPGDHTILDAVRFPPPMMSYVIRPASKGDADKIKTALERILDEDPTLSVSTDELTHQLVLNGMGQVQLDMAIERMRRKYKVSVTTSLPPVPYRETLRSAVQHVEGKHKKQTGGAGQFGVAFMNVSPLGRGGDYEFVDRIKGGAIPNQFIPSVDKGIRQRMGSGFLAGYPIVDIRVELVDGKYHPVDSKDVAFQLAGSKGLKAAFAKGGTVLLEPMMAMEIVVPNASMGDVMGDVTSRRGRVTGMGSRGRNTIIEAVAPLASVQRYAPELKGMTGGKGAFTMQLEGYEEVPKHLVAGIVSSSPFRKEEED